MNDWYNKQTVFLQQRFGKHWRLMAGLLAATSPLVRLATSWVWSVRIFDAFIDGREPDLSMLMRCQRPNVRRILQGKPLQGDKVRRFYANLIGDLEPVTIDTWMLRLFKWFERGTKRIPTMQQYARLERCFQKFAHNKNMEPAKMQALLWNGIRSRYGYKPVGFSYIEQETMLPF